MTSFVTETILIVTPKTGLLPADDNMPKLSALTSLARADDFSASIALNQYPGWSSLRQFADCPNVQKEIVGELWEPFTIRVLPTVAGVATVQSSSAIDTCDIFINGLDSNFHIITEVITITAAFPTNTIQEFVRINSMLVLTCSDPSSFNLGDISATIGGNLIGFIGSFQGTSQSVGFCVPSTHTLVVRNYTFHSSSSNEKTVRVTIQSRNPAIAASPWATGVNIYLGGENQYWDNEISVQIPGPYDLRVLLESEEEISAGGHFQAFLVDKDFL